MTGVIQLLNHKRSSTAVVGAVLLYLADSGVIGAVSDLTMICGTVLFGLFIASQTVLDGIEIWRGTKVTPPAS